MGCYTLYFSYKDYRNFGNLSLSFKSGAKKILGLFIISLPSLIAALIFYSKIEFHSSGGNLSISELIKWLNDGRALIVYNYVKEEIITEQFIHILIILFIISVLENIKLKKEKGLPIFQKADVLILPLSVALLFYFLTPNDSNAAMMSDRYSLIILMFGLAWIVARSVGNKLNPIIIGIVLVFHLYLTVDHFKTLKILNPHAITIHNMSDQIEDNSVVLSYNFSDHWMENWYHNYLGIDKPLIILGNFEATVGWFPVVWNYEEMPNVLLQEKSAFYEFVLSRLKSNQTTQVDYILLYGQLNKINHSDFGNLRKVLEEDFLLQYESEDFYAQLYKRK